MKRLFTIASLLLLAALASLSQNPRNVLVYNLTDTDCGPCSCMDSIIRGSLLPANPKTIIVALHSPSFNSHFRDYQGNMVYNQFNEKYEPSGFIDGLGYDVSYHILTDSVSSRFARSPEAPVSFRIDSKAWDPVTRNVSMTMTMKNLGTEIQGPAWINIFVTEDNLVQGHRIWTGCCTPTQAIPPYNDNFINDHVIRKLEYFEYGDSLIGPTWPAQQAVTRTCNVHIDSGWMEGNCHLVVAVYRHNDSLYKAPVLQAIKQSVTGGVGQEEMAPAKTGILQVFPNPAEDWVNIHFSVTEAGNSNLRIIDLQGKVLKTIVNRWFEPGKYNAGIQIRDLPAGPYLVVLRSGTEISSKDLIIR